MRRFWYRVCFVLVRIALFFWHPTLRVQGLENIPEGAAILCANHSGAADALWLLLGMNLPDLPRIMAKNELRRVPVVGWIMERFGIVFVKRGAHDLAAVEASIAAVRGGEKFLMFPEGTRCNGAKRVRAKTGAVRIAAATGAPIVPIFLTRNKTPFCPIDVIVGEPVFVSCPEDAPVERFHQAADEILGRIYEMGGESCADPACKNGRVLLRG